MNRMTPAAPCERSPSGFALGCFIFMLAFAMPGCAGSPSTLELGAAGAAREFANAALLRDVVGVRDTGDGARAARGSEHAFVVGVTPDELIAARLDRPAKDARIWRSRVTGASRPALAPGLIVVGSGRELLGLSPADGQRAWALPARDRVLLAATADRDQLALLLLDRRGLSSLVVYDRAAKGAPRERVRVTANGALGTPALLGGTLLVPWGAGYLSAVDARSQSELGRVRLGNELLHALWWGPALFFGGPPWVELTGGGAPPYELPRRPLPGAGGAALGPLGPAATEPASGAAIEADVTRLYVRPTRAGSADASDRYVATYGRIAFGLERERGALEWVVALPGRALAAVAIGDDVIVCDDSGGVRALSSTTGRIQRLWQLERQRRVTLGEPTLSACALAPGSVLGSGAGADTPAPEPLLEQLAKVLALSDPGLSDAQRFLSRELAARPEPDATRVLIDLVQRHSLDRVLQSEAEDLLATRRNGEEHMLAALSEGGARGEQALPAIAPLGEALAALGDVRAAPLLARQLNRPAHTASAIARAAAALEQLASEAEYGELSVFFSLHRTNADSPEGVAAVVSVGRTLLRVGGHQARTLIQFATRDPLTIPEIKQQLEQALGVSSPPPSTTPDDRSLRRDMAG